MSAPPPILGRAEPSDVEAVALLLGRRPSAGFSVVVRRTDGAPVVIENTPLLEDGRPMPTRFWLVDPELRESVSRLESSGGVKRAQAEVDPVELGRAHSRYAQERDAALPDGHTGPRPSGGVGGTRRGVKCLHAHLAWYLTGGDDPVGAWVAHDLAIERDDYRCGPDGSSRGGAVAAIDCGTNSTRLLVVSGEGAVLERSMRITRLGEGVDANGSLSREAIDRTVEVLREFRSSMQRHGVKSARLVATSATRDAANSEEFFSAAQAATGVRPELLSGEEEGSLSFAGATAHLPAEVRESGALLVADIGGGSTELVVADPARAEGGVVAVSLDIGCVRVSERFLHGDPPSGAELARAVSFVRTCLEDARARLPVPAQGGPLVGLAGTVSTVAALERRLARYEREAIHHTLLSKAEVKSWLGLLAGEDRDARLARPGMVEGREDVIVGGVMVLAQIMDVFDRPECLVSEDDILDGIAASVTSCPSRFELGTVR